MKKSKIINWCLAVSPLLVWSQEPKMINTGRMVFSDGAEVTTLFHFLNAGKDNGNQSVLINDGHFHLYSHFTNEYGGLVDFDRGGLTHFLADDRLQHIVGRDDKANFSEYGGVSEGIIYNDKRSVKGNAGVHLYDVEFDNRWSEAPVRYDLVGKMAVWNRADFNAGILDNKSTQGIMVFAKDNATEENAGNESYVNGRVDRYAGQGEPSLVKFPTGAGAGVPNADPENRKRVLLDDMSSDEPYNVIAENKEKQRYRYAKIEYEKNGKNRLATVEYFFDTDKMDRTKTNGTVEMVDANEVWYIEGGGEDKESFVLSLPWDEETTDPRLLASTDEMVIARWDETLGEWTYVGGLPNAGEKEVSATVSNNLKLDGRKSDSDITRGYFTLAKKYKKDTDLEVFNGISPNGDGLNDKFVVELKNGGRFERLQVRIYNRWGVLVFQSDDYGNGEENTFTGYSNGRLTVEKDRKLPTGTYFYVLDYQYKDNQNQTRSGTKPGYIYISDTRLGL